LIVADDGGLFPFNLHGTPSAIRSRVEIGTRVGFSSQASEPAARAIRVTPLDQRSDVGSPSAGAPIP
jgi:hypothetical protein